MSNQDDERGPGPRNYLSVQIICPCCGRINTISFVVGDTVEKIVRCKYPECDSVFGVRYPVLFGNVYVD